MVGWHHRLDGHEFEQAPGDSEGQGSLACCSSWGRKESDTSERLKNKQWDDNDDNVDDDDARVKIQCYCRKPFINIFLF